jgi:hypothetical protein
MKNATLIQAAKLVEAYIETLNVTQDTCKCCGVTKYEDFGDYRQFDELSAVVRKLRKFAKADPAILVD